MSASPPLSILRPSAWAALMRRLDETLAHDGTLAAARDVLLRPIELLELMATDAPGALGDQVLLAERLRMALYLASPFASLVPEAEQLGPAKTKPAVASDASISAYQPGIIDHGALLIVALAAIRVAPPGLGPLFLQTVHGLALAAAPAEALGRLEPAQPGGPALAVILNTLYLLDAVGTALKSPFLRPFAADPVERARWSCLSHLLQDELFSDAIKQVARWDGASAAGIEAVLPERAWPGDTVTLSGDLRHLGKGPKLASSTRIVFAAADRVPRAAALVSWKTSVGLPILTVEVPPDAEPGWVGFSDETRIEAANGYRSELAQNLLATFADEPSLRSTRVPVEQIRPIGSADPDRPQHRLAIPPRTAGNRFSGGLPRLTHAQLAPERVAPGGDLTLSWESQGADRVLLLPGGETLPPAGRRVLSAPMIDGALTYQLTPARARDGATATGPTTALAASVRSASRIGAVHVSQAGRQTPLVLGSPLDVEVALDPPTSTAIGHLILHRRAGHAAGDPARGAADGPPEGGLVLSHARGADGSPGLLRFVIPSTSVHDGLSFTVVIAESENAPPTDRFTRAALAVASVSTRTIVLVRPAVLDPEAPPVDLESARAALDRAAAALGISVEIEDLPWADDPLAVLVTPVRSADDARVPGLLNQLARRAVLTPGFEPALWLMLLPDSVTGGDGGGDGGDGDGGGGDGGDGGVILARGPSARGATAFAPRGVSVFLPSAAAIAVAIADTAELGELLAGVFVPPVSLNRGLLATTPTTPTTRGPTRRLRILGRISRSSEVDIESVQEETRAAGAGAPIASTLTAVALDAAGNERLAQPVMCMRDTRPALLALLLPVSDDVTAVELRDGRRVVERIIRTGGTAAFDDVALAKDDRLRWSYHHTRGARPAVTVALSVSGVSTAVLAVDPCDHAPILPLWRFRTPEALSLSASDGWNVVSYSIDEPPASPGPVVIRRLSDGRFWADIPDGWRPHWTLEGRTLGDERTVELAAGATGTLRLAAAPPTGAPPVVDVRPVEAEA